MKNLVKLKVILLVFAIIFASKSIAADKILPLPKPSVDKDTIIKSSKKKEIYPKKKPTKKKIETNIEIAETIETTDKEIFIFPKEKPIVVQKKVEKIVTKSSILSKKDFKIAKSVFKYYWFFLWENRFTLFNSLDNLLTFYFCNFFRFFCRLFLRIYFFLFRNYSFCFLIYCWFG